MLVKVNTGLSGTSRFRYKRLNLGKKNKAGDGAHEVRWTSVLRRPERSGDRTLVKQGFESALLTKKPGRQTWFL